MLLNLIKIMYISEIPPIAPKGACVPQFENQWI